ncbi:MAG: cytochrome c3 family protein [Chloroflexi bacterium]|nr:cytochrome c3 family protein [Chloroflexota bacterium]
MAVGESSWYQSKRDDRDSGQTDYGDSAFPNGEQSFGILQVKRTRWPGSYPMSALSTAYNADYAMAVVRMFYDGRSSLGSTTKGDILDSVAAWSCNCGNAGSGTYAQAFLKNYWGKPWQQSGTAPGATPRVTFDRTVGGTGTGVTSTSGAGTLTTTSGATASGAGAASPSARRAVATAMATATPAPTGSGPAVALTRFSPGVQATFQLAAASDVAFQNAVLSDVFPASWTVVNAGGGSLTKLDASTSKLSWTVGDLPAGTPARATYVLLAPTAASSLPMTWQASLTFTGGLATADPWTAVVSTPLVADHYRFGADKPGGAANWLAAIDTPLDGVQRFEPIRLRFQISNLDGKPVTWTPRLEWSTQPVGSFQILNVDDPESPFYVSRLVGAAATRTIPTTAFGLGAGLGKPEPGSVFSAENPTPRQTLGAGDYTEIEFIVRATAGATWTTPYFFRLTDAGTAIGGIPAVKLTMGVAPALMLSRQQYRGRDVSGSGSGPRRRSTRAEAPDADPSAASADPLGPRDGSAPVAQDAADTSAGVSFFAASLLAAPSYTNPHLAYSPTTDQCALCHRPHTAITKPVLTSGQPQSVLCFMCHDGSGASANIQSEYSDSSVPANDGTRSAFYSHPATASNSGHTSELKDEFAGVSSRHSECGDCHNPHRADPSLDATLTASGWTASGAIYHTTGVAISNGSAGTSPGYTWQTKDPGITYEYEQCLKCHSGYTQLPSYSTPSEKVTDKGRELNPANASYHPVEGAGKNASPALAQQLSSLATSPFKLWNFSTGDPVRCVNCHGNYRLANPNAPPPADGRLSPHTSRYRGLLMNSYEGRLLLPWATSPNYTASSFALCYQCHGEAPFVDPSGSVRADTDFQGHGHHTTMLFANPAANTSIATSIDTAGAGQGNALCAECHFRPHSTTSAVNAADQNNPRLVSFAPNVTGSTLGPTPIWDPVNQTCALTCHGKEHVTLDSTTQTYKPFKYAVP